MAQGKGDIVAMICCNCLTIEEMKKRRETGEANYLPLVSRERAFEPCSDFDFVPPTREQLAEFQKNRPEVFAGCDAIEAADAKRARKAAKRARDVARATKVKA